MRNYTRPKIRHFLFIGLLLTTAHAHAIDGTTMNPDEAQATWDSLTPAQQEAAKKILQQQASAKKEAWHQMTAEEKQAGRETMRTTMQSRVGAGMTTSRRGRN